MIESFRIGVVVLVVVFVGIEIEIGIWIGIEVAVAVLMVMRSYDLRLVDVLVVLLVALVEAAVVLFCFRTLNIDNFNNKFILRNLE